MGKSVLALSVSDKAGPGVAVSMDVFRVARRVIVTCSGAGKADGVKTGLQGKYEDPACPVGYLATEQTSWYVDTLALSKCTGDGFLRS
jgi:6-phosphogluconolactonase/glucosamine-6-phosphate isomerase/deaminase